MSEHMEEPLKAITLYADAEIRDASGKLLAVVEDHAHARRMAACVNACAGINIDYLETLVRESSSIHNEMMQRIQNKTAADRARAKAEQQRDDLMAALEALIENVDEPPDRNCSCHISPPCNDCVDFSSLREAFSQASAAIASVEQHKHRHESVPTCNGVAQSYGPDNPPRLRRPGESVQEYRSAMGWGCDDTEGGAA